MNDPNASITVLVAEDEPLTLKLLHFCLRQAGYQVLLATDGRQALDQLKQAAPDLVITDMLMPYHNGMEIIQYVKTALQPAPPVIILSASSEQASVQEALRLGADGFVAKPITPTELLQEVRKHLKAKRTGRT